VHDGDFLFNPRRHDVSEKIVLGQIFPAGGGYSEGLHLFDLLSHYPSTARFICRKIAIRFVTDTPSLSLVDRMAKTFIQYNGNVRSVLITMVSSPEFWAPSAIREKIKSPFELAVSAVRNLQVHIDDPIPLNYWITRMGEKIYNYQAPNGYPDKAQYWINSGSLLNRMNFGLAFASGRIGGISVDLLSLNNQHEPESALAALGIFGKILVPLGDSLQMKKRLSPLLNDPALFQKVASAASNRDTTNYTKENSDTLRPLTARIEWTNTKQNNIMLAQVVGLLIGSPEFQRR
ncbi:MAG: DUF1800 domain-containing protein, partial [Bacteroidota bacterium]|nr:DUF1800 domain-containing protein [Bacteroidota bacterium]